MVAKVGQGGVEDGQQDMKTKRRYECRLIACRLIAR